MAPYASIYKDSLMKQSIKVTVNNFADRRHRIVVFNTNCFADETCETDLGGYCQQKETQIQLFPMNNVQEKPNSISQNDTTSN